MEKYCPQCGCVCGGAECPTDEHGRCRRCGKPPVALADRNRSWLWCTHHDQWHDHACKENAAEHCCTKPHAA